MPRGACGRRRRGRAGLGRVRWEIVSISVVVDGNSGKRGRYLAMRSHVSAMMPMVCMTGRILTHMAVSMGTLVLSCLVPVLPPSTLPLASAVRPTRAVGSGTASATPFPSASGSPCGCLPEALLNANEAMLVTKLLASCSTASPLWFSGAPVALSWLPSTPARGFCTPPVSLSTRAMGAGGKRYSRDAGKPMRAMKTAERRGVRRLNSHAMK